MHKIGDILVVKEPIFTGEDDFTRQRGSLLKGEICVVIWHEPLSEAETHQRRLYRKNRNVLTLLFAHGILEWNSGWSSTSFFFTAAK